jgi:hypothetical protein
LFLQLRKSRNPKIQEMAASAEATAMDWPMSREEKKAQVMRLYNQDVKAADEMIQAGHVSVQSLQAQIDEIRRAIEKENITIWSEGQMPGGGNRVNLRNTVANFEQLRGTVESSAALLRAMAFQQDLHGDAPDDRSGDAEASSGARRCKSEGGLRTVLDVAPPKSALSRTPRNSRGCATPRRVSFGTKELVGDSDSEVEDRGYDGMSYDGLCSRSPQSNSHSSAVESPKKWRSARNRSAYEAEPEPEEEDSTAEEELDSPCEEDFCETVVLPEIQAGHDVEKLGFVLHRFPPDEMKIVRIIPGSWAEKSGMLPGDVIVVLNGVRVQYLNYARTLEILRKRPLRVLLERECCYGMDASPTGALQDKPDSGLLSWMSSWMSQS